MQAINEQSLRLLRLFGNTTSKKVTPSVGPEQEYFLVDKEMYLKREDLRLCGRALFGSKPPKGPELEVLARQIANAHTLFNLLCTLVWLPLTPVMVRLVCKLVPQPQSSR